MKRKYTFGSRSDSFRRVCTQSVGFVRFFSANHCRGQPRGNSAVVQRQSVVYSELLLVVHQRKAHVAEIVGSPLSQLPDCAEIAEKPLRDPSGGISSWGGGSRGCPGASERFQKVELTTGSGLAGIGAGADQVADSLVFGFRCIDRQQFTRAMQSGEFDRIAPVKSETGPVAR